MYYNWNYQNLWGQICRIEKNPIMISLYSIFEVWPMMKLLKLVISTLFSILYALLLQKHIQSHIPNNYKVINKNKMSCNTLLCPYLSSVWEHNSKILHIIHFNHVIWHYISFCNICAWKMSPWVCCDISRLISTW
jgi:hypothetical protein